MSLPPKEIFGKILRPESLSDDPGDLRAYGADRLKDFAPAASLVLFPETYEQVQEIVRAARMEKLALVPSGGRTGLSGGASACRGEVVVSLAKLQRILDFDPMARTLKAQAGAITQKIQEAAESKGLMFPVDFASKGSSQIGGNIATNAGGIRVIRYGNIRDWVLGLKVVIGDGTLLDFNGELFKNQTGYDLRNLMIGSEGTLGIIVEATLKLCQAPREVFRGLLPLDSVGRCAEFLPLLRERAPRLSLFELFDDLSLRKVIARQGGAAPFSKSYPYYVLFEVEDLGSEEEDFKAFLFEAIESGRFEDAVVAESEKQRSELLSLRENISETLSHFHTVHKNDVSVPIAHVPSFVEELKAGLAAIYPEFEVAIFGHVGDGNLHVNVLKPAGLDDAVFFKRCRDADLRIFEIVGKYGGSISAEHGVGLLKKDFLGFSRKPAEIAIMKQIKAAFDPDGIFNPGKIFD